MQGSSPSNQAVQQALGVPSWLGGAGTLISNQLLNQEAYLRRDIVNDNFSIQNTGDHLIVTLPQDFLFAIDSTSVRSDFMADSHTLSINLRS